MPAVAEVVELELVQVPVWERAAVVVQAEEPEQVWVLELEPV